MLYQLISILSNGEVSISAWTQHVDEYSVDPDLSWLHQKPADLDLHCFEGIEFKKCYAHLFILGSIW